MASAKKNYHSLARNDVRISTDLQRVPKVQFLSRYVKDLVTICSYIMTYICYSRILDVFLGHIHTKDDDGQC